MIANYRNTFRLLASLLIAGCMMSNGMSRAQGTWAPVTAAAPDSNNGVMLLLSDGTVMAKSVTDDSDLGYNWDRLTPDIHGSYKNGTWSKDIADMHDTRLYFSSKILKDGRVYVAGGEYGTGRSKAEIYDPLTNVWTSTPNPGHSISDANSALLPDGRVLNAHLDYPYKGTIIYNPTTNSWTTGPVCSASHSESSWMLLPDNSILFVDRLSFNSERYIPALNQWVPDAVLPVDLYDIYVGEAGAGFLLPDSRVFLLGSTGHTAYYTPSGNNTPGSWAAGPDIPGGLGTPDAAAAMMVNGKILFAASPVPNSTTNFPAPTYFLEFNYLTNTYTQVNAPRGGSSANMACYYTNMLDLPDGNVLYSQLGSNRYYIYTPSGSPVAAGKPTINTITQMNCTTFTVSGTLFNGISEGAAYGDDWQMSTNYPIVRLTSGTNVYYARTFNWNSSGVMRGNLADSTQFTLPAGLPTGKYLLQVVANGIASDTVSFTPFPMLSSALTPPAICSNTLFTYTPTSDASGATFTWTRPSVSGIGNVGVTTPQILDPYEILINTTSVAKTVAYSYSVTANGCNGTQQVAVIVNPSPAVSFTGLTPDSVCMASTPPLTLTGIPPAGTFGGNGMIGSSFHPSTAGAGWSVISYDYTNIQGCGNSFSDSIFVEVCTAVNNINKTASPFTIYPNPSNDVLYIKGTLPVTGDFRISLSNAIGQVIDLKETMAHTGLIDEVLNVKDLPAGLYFLSVTSGETKQVFKIQKY